MPRGRKARATKAGRPRIGRGTLLSPLIGASLIATFAYAASLLQASSEVVAAAALTYAAAEGLVLAILGALWSPRGIGMAIAVAVLTALLATPGRWGLAYLHAGRTAPLLDLLEDLGVTVLWAALAGLAGATLLRQRLGALLPGR
jgi:hypothetical protein